MEKYNDQLTATSNSTNGTLMTVEEEVAVALSDIAGVCTSFFMVYYAIRYFSQYSAIRYFGLATKQWPLPSLSGILK